MNFKEAYQKMLEGKKVKRKGWEDWQHYKLIGDNMYYANKLIASNVSVENALANDWEVVKETKSKVWKPNIGENYFFITSSLEVNKFTNEGDMVGESIISSYNCFKTEEEAQHMIEKLKVIRELQDLSNIKPNMSDYVKNNRIYYIAYDFTQNRIVPLFDNISRNIPFNVYFSTKEDCEKAITKIGKERLERYYFDMED